MTHQSTYMRYATRMLSADAGMLAKSTAASRSKVKVLAALPLLPAALWAVSGYLMASCLYGASWPVSVGAGLAMAAFIFMIERMVLASSGHWAGSLFRIVMAIVAAYLGAIFFDLVIFQKDIDQQMPLIREQHAQQAQQAAGTSVANRLDIAAQKNTVDGLQQIYLRREDEATRESDGMGGSGVKGAGSATRFKKQQANEAKQDLEKAQAWQQVMEAEITRVQDSAYTQAKANFDAGGLLYRVKGLNSLRDNNPEINAFYWWFFSLLMCIELLVVVVKMAWPKTAYEQEVALQDTLLRRRLTLMAQQGQAASAARQPVSATPRRHRAADVF